MLKEISLTNAWPMLLIAFLTVAFFVGGVYLELEAADHGLRKIAERFGSNPQALSEALAFQKARVDRVHEAAQAAIDISKIGLGAVVALATQHLTASGRSTTSDSGNPASQESPTK